MEGSGGDRRGQLAELVLSLASLASFMVATHPEAAERLVYRARLWWANRDATNFHRLRWMREQARSGLRYRDDMAPAAPSPGEHERPE